MDKKIDLKRDWKLFALALIATIIAELIGSKTIKISSVNIVLSPLIWAMVLVFIIYKLPLKTKVLSEKDAGPANFMMGITLALLIAKLGVASGSQIEEIKQAGLALVLQNFGNLGTIILSLPIAILLGVKRESVGMCHALSREANVGLIQDNYGANSPEFRGVMAVYIIGTIFGPIMMGVLPSIFTGLGIVSPLAASMGTGAGSASMMTAGLAALIETYPELEAQMTAFAGLSNLISSVIALPLGLFLGLPITEWLYNKLAAIRFGKDGGNN